MSKMDEMILAISRKELFGSNDELAFQGVHRNIDLLGTHEPVVKRRGDLEENPEYKQLITYCIIVEQEEGKVLMYQRIGGGDARLHMKSSIGVGGHANLVEDAANLHQTMQVNAMRELYEELTIASEVETELFGYLNDDSDAVGEVHLGVIYRITVPTKDAVQVAETDTLKMSWVTKAELTTTEGLENWSKLLVPYL